MKNKFDVVRNFNVYTFGLAFVLIFGPLFYTTFTRQNNVALIFKIYFDYSFPILAGAYSLFWLVLTTARDKKINNIAILRQRKEVNKKTEDELNNLSLELNQRQILITYIERALRYFILIIAVFKILAAVIS